MTEPTTAPPWCPSSYRTATCLIASGHKGNHAGNDLDGHWLRWTDENPQTPTSAKSSRVERTRTDGRDGRAPGLATTGAPTVVWRTVYRRQRDLDRHPDVDPARLPLSVYSSSDNLDFARSDLAYLRSDEHDAAQAWIETRIEHPWERTDD